MDEDRGEWGGLVEKGDRVGFTWGHRDNNAGNKTGAHKGPLPSNQVGDGCEIVVSLTSHNGRPVTATNRHADVRYLPEALIREAEIGEDQDLEDVVATRSTADATRGDDGGNETEMGVLRASTTSATSTSRILHVLVMRMIKDCDGVLVGFLF